jgi:HAD superfamily hydrolase (TIGR01509 family)
MQAILFDRGNTLVQFGETDYDAGQKLLLASIRPPGAVDAVSLGRFEDEVFTRLNFYRKRANLEYNLLHYYELMSRYFGIQFDKPYEELCWRHHFVAERISLISGAQRVLEELKRAGFRLGLVTNTSLPHAIVVEEFKQLALHEYFDTVVCSSEIIFRKPDRAMFDVALRTLRVSPAETVFVGDSYEADIIGAHKAGIKTIWLNPDCHPLPGEINPDYNIAELEEILELPEIKRKV